MYVRIGTSRPGTSSLRTTPIFVSLLPLRQSPRLRHLRRKMVRPGSQVPQHPKVSLELQYYLPAIPRAMARGKARVARDRDRLLQAIHQRPSVTSTSTKATANTVTNANTAILNIIGIEGRTKVTRARKVDRPLREDRKLLVGRRTETAMGG